jgi:hypothetical protein
MIRSFAKSWQILLNNLKKPCSADRLRRLQCTFLQGFAVGDTRPPKFYSGIGRTCAAASLRHNQRDHARPHSLNYSCPLGRGVPQEWFGFGKAPARDACLSWMLAFEDRVAPRPVHPDQREDALAISFRVAPSEAHHH